jgi:hypothetical protein
MVVRESACLPIWVSSHSLSRDDPHSDSCARLCTHLGACVMQTFLSGPDVATCVLGATDTLASRMVGSMTRSGCEFNILQEHA